MDNDLSIVKFAKGKIKQAKYNWDYRDISMKSAEEGNQFIAQQVQGNAPFAALRAGATEMRCVAEFLKHKDVFSDKIKKEISELSGVFPATDAVLEKFCTLYIDSMTQADLLALWGVGAEAKVVHKYCAADMQYTDMCALEPYYFAQPWSKELQGKKVLVIHPFAKTIEKQWAKREVLFADANVLPAVQSLTCLPAVQSIAGQATQYADWFEALDFMKAEIDKADFDVAIIGAGAYGLPLAAHCKQIGKQAVQMSGATQILFGIKGKRWDTHAVISGFYNEHWVRPDVSETPPAIEKVEGGSYW